MTKAERLTAKVTETKERYIPKDGCADLGGLLKHLGEYEDTGLSPDEISDLLSVVWSAILHTDAAASSHLWKLRSISEKVIQMLPKRNRPKTEDGSHKAASTSRHIPWEAD